jgi:hypothetical protein
MMIFGIVLKVKLCTFANQMKNNFILNIHHFRNFLLNMETISIQIINPKAKQLLKELAKLNLITIKRQISLKGILNNMRKSDNSIPSIDEITAEVEQVRSERYAKRSIA